MKEKELLQLGIPRGAALQAALRGIHLAEQGGMSRKEIRKTLRILVRNPGPFLQRPHFGELAALLGGGNAPPAPANALGREAPFQQWGTHLDPKSIEQMHRACSLPISVRGALMPDAHVGYGLPIGGVLATRGAVVPYAVGGHCVPDEADGARSAVRGVER